MRLCFSHRLPEGCRSKGNTYDYQQAVEWDAGQQTTHTHNLLTHEHLTGQTIIQATYFFHLYISINFFLSEIGRYSISFLYFLFSATPFSWIYFVSLFIKLWTFSANHVLTLFPVFSSLSHLHFLPKNYFLVPFTLRFSFVLYYVLYFSYRMLGNLSKNLYLPVLLLVIRILIAYLF